MVADEWSDQIKNCAEKNALSVSPSRPMWDYWWVASSFITLLGWLAVAVAVCIAMAMFCLFGVTLLGDAAPYYQARRRRDSDVTLG
jgi:hypothetical protein